MTGTALPMIDAARTAGTNNTAIAVDRTWLSMTILTMNVPSRLRNATAEAVTRARIRAT
jgi:hypothetical protein